MVEAAKPPTPLTLLDYNQELLQQPGLRDPLARLRDPIQRAQLLEQERRRLERVSPKLGRARGVVKKPRLCSECNALTLHALDGDRWICTECARIERSPHKHGEEPPKPAKERTEGGSTRPAYCGAMSMVGIDPSTGKAVYKRMWCNTYACPSCGPRRYRRARKAIAAAAEKERLTKFWTLTLDPKKLPVDGDVKAQVKYLRECWRKLRVYLQRKHGRSIAFIAVVELHKSGVPHLHVLLAEWIDHAWMKRAWSAVGGGEIVWVEPISIRRVSAYLAKYITKERLNNLPTSIRRFSASQGISLFGKVPKPEDNHHWFVCRLPLDLLRSLAQTVEDERLWANEQGEPILIWFIAEILFLTQHFKLKTFARRPL